MRVTQISAQSWQILESSEMSLAVSVVIATHNRADFLRKALEGLSRQTLHRDAFEVIVVDNASTDETRQVVNSYRSRGNVHYIFMSTLGASIARNAGWRAAQSPLVAFLDDDAIPATNWLTSIIHAFENVEPKPSCMGGRVEPLYEVPPPSWLQGPLLDFLTVIDHSPEPKFLTDIMHRQKLASVNMAVLKSALERVGGFHPSLDRIGKNLLSGGEVLIQLQLEKLDLPVYYDPGVTVLHHVSAARLKPNWLVERAYWGGVSDSLLSYFNRPQNLWWALRTVSWSLRAALFSPRLMSSLLLLRNDDEATVVRAMAWHRLGGVMGAVRALRLALTKLQVR